jgi:hypothetical protein
VFPPEGSISTSGNFELTLQSIPVKVPMIGVPFPISKLIRPNSFVVWLKVSWQIIVPPTVASWMLMRIPTV